MKNPKVGERVRVYGVYGPHIGVIERIAMDSLIVVRSMEDLAIVVHSKQCRKLVKKKRIEIWVNIYPETMLICSTKEEADKHFSPGLIRCAKFREVSEK